jgi:hypothetical protein
LNRPASSPERPGGGFGCDSGRVETVFHVERHRPADRVAAIDRIGPADHLRIGDRKDGQQVPLDHVAERFVGPHRAQIDDDSLRLAKRGRGGEAANRQAALQRIAKGIKRRDSPKATVQHVRQASRPRSVERCAAKRVDVGGNALGRDHAT